MREGHGRKPQPSSLFGHDAQGAVNRPFRGLTLVEVMISMALLAVLMGISVPYLLAALPGQRAAGAARQVTADLRLARTLAVEKGTRTFLAFDPAVGTYRLILDDDGTAGLTTGDTELKTVSIPDGYEAVTVASAQVADPVTFGGDAASFLPRGTSNGGAIYLMPSGHPEEERKVTVLSTTGRARAYRWNPSTGTWE